MTTTLDIKIQGREYRVACAAGEAAELQAAAELLEARMGQIAAATRSTGERLAVMTALNLAHELNTVGQTATSAPAPQEIDEKDVLRRIKFIEAQLDAVLAPQEQLF